VLKFEILAKHVLSNKVAVILATHQQEKESEQSQPILQLNRRSQRSPNRLQIDATSFFALYLLFNDPLLLNRQLLAKQRFAARLLAFLQNLDYSSARIKYFCVEVHYAHKLSDR
jgi:hypothetical protein